MQRDQDMLGIEWLSRRVTGWDQDLRCGLRGVEQLTMFLHEVVPQGRTGGHSHGCAPDSSPRYSPDDVELALCPGPLAEFKMLAAAYLLKVPGLLAAIDQYEALLRANQAASLQKREGRQQIS